MRGKREAERPKIKRRTLFTVVVLIANFHDHVVSSELTVAWFAAWTVELGLLAGIKIKDSSEG